MGPGSGYTPRFGNYVLDYRRPLAAILIAITLVSGYGLGTRLVPDRIGVFNPVAGYRLEAPIGYWNALGIVAGARHGRLWRKPG